MNTSPNTARTEPRTAAEPATATASASTELRGTSSNKPLSIEKQTGADAPGCANPVEKCKSLLKDYRPITFKVVCAIARMVLLRRPAFDDSDWKEAVKVVAIKQGWEAPSSEMLARALGAVERALRETTGFSRPVEAPSAPHVEAPASGWTSADYRALAKTMREISARTAAVTPAPANVTPITLVRLDLSEPAALDQFYAEAQEDRVAALKRFAEIAIVRPPEWDFAAVREAAPTVRVMPQGGCFGCRQDRRQIHRHHVIQIQHGGSNHVRNIVALCAECHARVHPWLPQAAKAAAGWVKVGAILEVMKPLTERRKAEAS